MQILLIMIIRIFKIICTQQKVQQRGRRFSVSRRLSASQAFVFLHKCSQTPKATTRPRGHWNKFLEQIWRDPYQQCKYLQQGISMHYMYRDLVYTTKTKNILSSEAHTLHIYVLTGSWGKVQCVVRRLFRLQLCKEFSRCSVRLLWGHRLHHHSHSHQHHHRHHHHHYYY